MKSKLTIEKVQPKKGFKLSMLNPGDFFVLEDDGDIQKPYIVTDNEKYISLTSGYSYSIIREEKQKVVYLIDVKMICKLSVGEE